MATRSNIILKHKESKLFIKVYCHFDGYPENVGALLNEYYNTYNKALKLVLMGDISILGKTIKKSKFYTRDMEGFTPPVFGVTDERLDLGEEYVYRFDEENGLWKHEKIELREVD